jgi:hypothetical protein
MAEESAVNYQIPNLKTLNPGFNPGFTPPFYITNAGVKPGLNPGLAVQRFGKMKMREKSS